MERTQLNSTFVESLKPRVEGGKTGYTQRVVFNVQELDAEVLFWTDACGMRVSRDTGKGANRRVVLCFGQETLTQDDGGKAGIELVQAPEGRDVEVGDALGYIQLTIPFGVRVSRIYDAGKGLGSVSLSRLSFSRLPRTPYNTHALRNAVSRRSLKRPFIVKN